MTGQKGVLVYLGLGSNLGDREAHLQEAIEAIRTWPGTLVSRVSPLYSSAPWGPVEQPDYLNLVVEATTNLEPRELLRRAKAQEAKQGRETGVKWGPRPIDIDILMYGDHTVDEPDLQVPHPRIWERAFVLKPLSDLRPDLRDVAGGSIMGTLENADIQRQRVDPYPPETSRNEKE